MSRQISTRAKYTIVTPDRRLARMLHLMLRLEAMRLFFSRRERIGLSRVARTKADVIVYGFDPARLDEARYVERQIEIIGGDRAPVKIVMQLASPTIHGPLRAEIDRKNGIIESIARRVGAHIVMTADVMHSGATRRLAKSGRPNLRGYAHLAHVVLRAIKVQVIRSTVSTSPQALGMAPPKGSRSKLPGIDEALSAMSWKSPQLPANLAINYSRENAADFADNIVFFPSFRVWGKFPLGEPIDWAMAGANWSWQSYFTGLEFVRAPMALWYDSVGGRDGKPDRDTLAALAERGKTPEDFLRRASFIIADFLKENPPAAPKTQRAYFQGTILRRVKVFLTYLICAKRAAELGTPLPREESEIIFRGLADCLEMLKSDEVYPKAGNHGVRQDVLFIVAGLLWHQLPYGRELLDLGMNRLKRYQLALALSPDGVWLENSFGYHCGIMNQFVMTAEDLRTAGAPGVDVFHDGLRRMAVHVEAMTKCDGTGPLLGDSSPARHFTTLAETVEELAQGDGIVREPLTLKNFRRAKDAYIFPSSGYFASHSNRDMDPNGSSVILSANLSTPKHKQADDLSIVFTHGATDLLVDGGTFNKEISDTVRNAARYDPASHNSFRVNGHGYPVRAAKGTKPAGVSAMWEGKGWAAVRAFNTAYADGRVERFVIHLKQHHAVIVLDRLAAKGSSPLLFEQFWHVAPEFAQQGALAFVSPDKGTLIAAFDGDEAECEVRMGGPGDPIAWLMLPNDDVVPTPYIRRAKTLRDGTMASLFQWTHGAAANLEISYAARKGATEITAHGVGFTCRFVASENGVSCLELNPPSP